MNYKEYEEKYARLLINKCLVNDGVKPLLIVVESVEILPFATLCFKIAKKCGYREVNIFTKKSHMVRC